MNLLPDVEEEVVDEAGDRLWDLEHEIAATPATTLAGLAAKASVIRTGYRGIMVDENEGSSTASSRTSRRSWRRPPMADALARRGFLRGLAHLPLIGGGVTLLGNPTAAAEPVTEELLDSYSEWLHYERRLLAGRYPAPTRPTGR